MNSKKIYGNIIIKVDVLRGDQKIPIQIEEEKKYGIVKTNIYKIKFIPDYADKYQINVLFNNKPIKSLFLLFFYKFLQFFCKYFFKF